MIRLKLFALMIAFALLALVRPRKVMELLEAADAGAAANEAEVRARYNKLVQRAQCPLPPRGWRCTRAAGHSGPCAAVAK